MNKLTQAAREKKVKVFFMRIGHPKAAIGMGVWGRKRTLGEGFVTIDSWGYEMDERVDIRDRDVVLGKFWPSAFFGTPLAPMFTAARIDTVIVTGCTTAGCVYATKVDSSSHGFRTIVISDGVADRTKETHDAFLWNIDQKYAEVMGLEQVIAAVQELSPLDY